MSKIQSGAGYFWELFFMTLLIDHKLYANKNYAKDY